MSDVHSVVQLNSNEEFTTADTLLAVDTDYYDIIGLNMPISPCDTIRREKM